MAATREIASFCCPRQICAVLQKLLNDAESFCSIVQTSLRQQNEAVSLATAILSLPTNGQDKIVDLFRLLFCCVNKICPVVSAALFRAY